MASSTIAKVHSFTSDHPIGPNNLCHVDVTFKPEVAGNHTLCIQAKDNRSVQIYTVIPINVYITYVYKIIHL